MRVEMERQKNNGLKLTKRPYCFEKIIQIKNQGLVVENDFINLKNKKQILTLLYAYENFEAYPISRQELLRICYKISGDCSGRMLYSSITSLVKLISRLRKMLSDRFGEDYPEIDWFYYDNSKKLWYLYEIRDFDDK